MNQFLLVQLVITVSIPCLTLSRRFFSLIDLLFHQIIFRFTTLVMQTVSVVSPVCLLLFSVISNYSFLDFSGTFVIFIYEFAHAESLYRTYGAYRISSNHTMVPIRSPKTQSPMVSQTQIPNSQPVQPMTNSIQRHFENGTLKFEDFILDGNGSQGDEGYEMDSYLQSTPNTSCLEDILEVRKCN